MQLQVSEKYAKPEQRVKIHLGSRVLQSRGLKKSQEKGANKFKICTEILSSNPARVGLKKNAYLIQSHINEELYQ